MLQEFPPRQYKVFGDYGYKSPVELECFNSYNEAMRWANHYAMKENAGNYTKISVVYGIVPIEEIVFITEWEG